MGCHITKGVTERCIARLCLTPQLEEEEDWENSQFADTDTKLINRHNTHSENERI